jgi:hypothetical protein
VRIGGLDALPPHAIEYGAELQAALRALGASGRTQALRLRRAARSVSTRTLPLSPAARAHPSSSAAAEVLEQAPPTMPVVLLGTHAASIVRSAARAHRARALCAMAARPPIPVCLLPPARRSSPRRARCSATRRAKCSCARCSASGGSA